VGATILKEFGCRLVFYKFNCFFEPENKFYFCVLSLTTGSFMHRKMLKKYVEYNSCDWFYFNNKVDFIGLLGLGKYDNASKPYLNNKN